MTTPIAVRLVGGPADGRIEEHPLNTFGAPPAAIGHLGTSPLRGAEAAPAELRGMDMPYTPLYVRRSDYFYTGATDVDYRPLYVHQSLNSWWGAPNDEDRPEDPWEAPGGWRWVRYVGGALDGVLDRLPVRVTRWHDWRTTRVLDPHGVMIYLWNDLRTWA